MILQIPLLQLNLGGVYYSAKIMKVQQNHSKSCFIKTRLGKRTLQYAWSLFQKGKTAGAVAVMKNV